MKGGTLNKPNLLVLGLGVIGVITAGLIMLQKTSLGLLATWIVVEFSALVFIFCTYQ